jgi:hypothetical protein
MYDAFIGVTMAADNKIQSIVTVMTTPRAHDLAVAGKPSINFQTGYYTARGTTAIKQRHIRGFDPVEDNRERSSFSSARYHFFHPCIVGHK